MDGECPVCYEALRHQIQARTPCGHVVCLRCLLALRRRACPLCRADLAPHFPDRVAVLTLLPERALVPRPAIPPSPAIPPPSRALVIRRIQATPAVPP